MNINYDSLRRGHRVRLYPMPNGDIITGVIVGIGIFVYDGTTPVGKHIAVMPDPKHRPKFKMDALFETIMLVTIDAIDAVNQPSPLDVLSRGRR